MTTFRISLFAAAVAAAFSPAVFAQQPPDAGQTLQQQQQQMPQLPRSGPAVEVLAPATSAVKAGGPEVVLAAIGITGASVFSEAELLASLGDYSGKSYDLAGLRGLAEKVSNHYRAHGYPFARAFIPQQSMADGNLRIEVVEGRYGKVSAQGDVRAQDFLDSLRSGEVIHSDTLERATLLLDDLPGLKTTPIIRPGQEVGTGDLDVRVERTAAVTGDVGLDNHGNRYTGQHRLRANLQWNSPFMLGDQFSLRSLYSEENMWLGSLSYSLPLGSSGLRGQIGYAHTYYELAKDFKSLDATGTAKVSSLGLSYPLIRSQRSNLNVSAVYQHKRLRDEQGSAASDDRKSSDSFPVTLSFDHRDSLGGGGITYGSVIYTWGDLQLDRGLCAADRASGQDTRGNFNKFNLDIARLQALPAGFTLFGRFSGQWADRNLDSSESFSLGGAYGVRAYPSGEGNGDEGWLAQLELRYSLGAFAPYLFHDAGRVKINAKPGSLVPAVADNHRSISGSGLGVRYQQEGWNLDASVAWREHGGRPESDTKDRNPRLWISAGYQF